MISRWRIHTLLQALFMFVMIAAVLPVAVTMAQEQAIQAEVTVTPTSNLLIRSGPGTSYPASGSVPTGTVLQALGRDAAGSWAYIDYNGTRSWIAAWLCTVGGELGTLPVLPPDGSRVLSAAAPIVVTGLEATSVVNLNMRTGPGMPYAMLTTVPQGTPVPVLSQEGDWLQVNYNGTEGWIAGWLATVSQVETQPEQPAACDCSGNSYNCADFGSHAQAQSCFDYCNQTVGYDVHQLDGDNDGSACEALPVESVSQPDTQEVPAVCDCSGNHYNCANFSSHGQAQSCFEYCKQTVGYDVHRLDGDNDGSACESLP